MIAIHDLVNPQTGKTYKEENLELRHNIPLETLVELKWDEYFGDGGCWKVHARMWVVRHTRDCDGSPLYSVGGWRGLKEGQHHGFGEDDLRPIEVTQDILDGCNTLEWEDDEWHAWGEG